MANARRTRRTYRTVGSNRNNPAELVDVDDTDFGHLDIDTNEAEELSSSFHGRGVREIEDIQEVDKYDDSLAELGEVEELNILTYRKKTPMLTPIKLKGYGVRLAGKKNQLYLIGGDQKLDLEDLDELLGGQQIDGSKNLLYLGQCHSIVYFTDKHHLTGPKNQKKGVPYEHEFGEQTGPPLPQVVYDVMNERLTLVGGNYEIRSEGIWN